MTKPFSRTKTRPVSGTPAAVPVPVHDLERTREIPAAAPPNAAPQQAIPVEQTVPVQSCIERTLLHELLRRESAEDEEAECGKPEEDG